MCSGFAVLSVPSEGDRHDFGVAELSGDEIGLFLDEATSHLDRTMESDVNHHVVRLGITRVLVAHRQETIQAADRAVELYVR
jgi:ABC-type transport system involved in cytochrome bd biosynthesis fused ATPase/permease subunit